MRYIQVPAGWWQDQKGTMQPPGSFLDPALRIKSKNSTVRNELSSTRRSHRLLDSFRRRTL
jgi:hypothetical protein